MNKKLITILTIFALLLNCVIPIVGGVKAANSSVKLNIEADKTVVHSEEAGNITYTVSIETTAKLTGMQMNFKVPEGMTFVSATLNDNLINEVNMAEGATRFDEYDFTTDSMILTFGCLKGCTLKTGNADILTIVCKINDTSKKANYLIGFAQDDDGFIGYQFVGEVDGHSGPISNDAISMNIDTVSVIVSATGLILTPNRATVKAGKTETLTATLTPADAEDEIVWESNNTQVADVKEGVVTAKKIGNATITAKTANGKYSATCEITVECAHEHTDEVEEKQPTCTEPGNHYYKKCLDCGEIIDGTDEPIAALGHTYNFVPEKAPVHTAESKLPGQRAHYECGVCGKLFDEKKNEVSENELSIPSDHNYVNPTKKDEEVHESTCGCGSKITGKHSGGTATCTEQAICDVCKEPYGDLNPNNHKPESLEVREHVEPTCTEEGYTGDVYCTDCDTLVEEGEVIAPLGHKGDATCTVEAECEICGEMYLDPNNHVNTETRNAVEATEEKEGYTGDIYCTDCEELIEEGTIIPKLVPAEKEDEKPADPTKPETGDNSNIMLWISLLVISGISLVELRRCKVNKERKH